MAVSVNHKLWMFAADYERDSFQILPETVFDVCESSHKFIQFIVNSSMSDICHQYLNFGALAAANIHVKISASVLW